MIPENFKVEVDQQKPFAVELRIGKNVLVLGVAALLTVLYMKKAR